MCICINNKKAEELLKSAILNYAKDKNIDLSNDKIKNLIKEIKTNIVSDKKTTKKTNEKFIEEQFMFALINLASSQNILLSDKKVKDYIKKLKLDIDKCKKELFEINSMVFVKGERYQPSFCDEEKEVFDLKVGKYPVTQELYQEIMGYNPSYFKGENRPVENMTWWDALNFCNELSEKYNLAPVYDLEEKKEGKLKINQLNGEKVSADKANFADTEGFRLPTEIEWEWFARGGEIAIQNGTFNYKYSGSNIIEEVAWYKKNSKNQTHDVGLKKANQLGLYDCSGNVYEWCYDTAVYIRELEDHRFEVQNIKKGKLYIYSFKKTVKNRVLKGGTYYEHDNECEINNGSSTDATLRSRYFGFRVVRTV